ARAVPAGSTGRGRAPVSAACMSVLALRAMPRAQAIGATCVAGTTFGRSALAITAAESEITSVGARFIAVALVVRSAATDWTIQTTPCGTAWVNSAPAAGWATGIV